MDRKDSSIEGSLLKLKKSSITGPYWKPHWVYFDHEKLLQWQSKYRPIPGDIPKNVFLLSEYRIEQANATQYRPRAIQIVNEKTSKIEAVFAIDKIEEYVAWEKILFPFNHVELDTNQSTTEHSNLETKSESSSLGDISSLFSKNPFHPKVEQEPADFVKDYFTINNESKDLRHLALSVTALKSILFEMDSSLNPSTTIFMIVRDINLTAESLITYDEFNSWWTRYKMRNSETNQIKITDTNIFAKLNNNDVSSLMTTTVDDVKFQLFQHSINFRDYIYLTGFFHSNLIDKTNDLEFMLRAKTPQYEEHREPELTYFNKTTYRQDNNDWNDIYQNALEHVYRLQSNQRNDAELDDILLKDFKPHLNFNRDLDEHGLTTDNHSISTVQRIFTEEDVITAILSVMEIHGAFNNLALEGMKSIIDEYSLPNEFKTIPSIELDDPTKDISSELKIGKINKKEKKMKGKKDKGLLKTKEIRRQEQLKIHFYRKKCRKYHEDLLTDSDRVMGIIPSGSSENSVKLSQKVNDSILYNMTFWSPNDTQSVENSSIQIKKDKKLKSNEKLMNSPKEDKINHEKEQIFCHGGLVFRLWSSKSIVDDYRSNLIDDEDENGLSTFNHEPTRSDNKIVYDAVHKWRLQSICTKEYLWRKLAGNEHRGNQFMQQTIDDCYTDYQLWKKWNSKNPRIMNADEFDNNLGLGSVFESEFGDFEKEDASHSKSTMKGNYGVSSRMLSERLKRNSQMRLKPCTLLETVVDYAGYRATVFAPTDFDENLTLVYGFTSQQLIVPKTDLTEDVTRRRFVNALPAYTKAQKLISQQLNIEAKSITIPTYSTTIADNEPGPEGKILNSTVNVVNSKMQAHKGLIDDRVYILNMDQLIPTDLPRKGTLDVLVRQFRPEFIKSLVHPIVSEGYKESDTLNSEETKRAISTSNYYYTEYLPSISKKLDSTTDVILDSHALTSFLHSHGVNIRHIGILFSMCNTLYIKQLLLTEAIARAGKVTLGNILRRSGRVAQAEALRAKMRNLSSKNDFIEHMDSATMKRNDIILELYNDIIGGIGSGDRDTSFWDGPLHAMVYEKFGISLQKTDRESFIYAPQLFIALQYHTGVAFYDASFKHIGMKDIKKPFTLEDVSVFVFPTSKQNPPLPSEIGRTLDSADSFLINGLFTEAMSIYQLLLSCQTLINPIQSASTKHLATLAYTTYKLALSHYLSDRIEDASRVMKIFIASVKNKYIPIIGRMLTLLMTTEFKLGHHDKSNSFYDLGLDIYITTLGSHHPICALHMCALADLFHGVNAMKQSKVMLLLAQSALNKALGQNHFLFPFVVIKLGAIQMENHQYQDAIETLNKALTLMDAIFDANPMEPIPPFVANERIFCSYYLGVSLMKCDYVDLSIQVLKKCLNYFEKDQDGNILKLSTMWLSCQIILSDLYIQKNEMKEAFDLLYEVWSYLRSRVHRYKHSGKVLAKIVHRIIELSFSCLSMPTQTLFEIISSEVKSGLHGILEPQTWHSTCDYIISSLWEKKTAVYFEELTKGLQAMELSANDDHHRIRKELGRDSLYQEFPSSSYALQAAAIFQLLLNNEDVFDNFMHSISIG